MAFGATRIIDYDRQPQDPGATDTATTPIKGPLIVREIKPQSPPAYYVEPIVMTQGQGQTYQFTGTQLIIGAILLYLLLKG